MTLAEDFARDALARVPAYLGKHENHFEAGGTPGYEGRHRKPERRWFAGRPRPSRTETGEKA